VPHANTAAGEKLKNPSDTPSQTGKANRRSPSGFASAYPRSGRLGTARKRSGTTASDSSSRTRIQAMTGWLRITFPGE